MVLNLTQIFDITGENLSFSYDMDLSEYPLYGAYPFITPVHLEGEVKNRAGVVELHYTAQFTLSLACDRCLTDFTRDYTLPFSEILVSNGDTNEDEYIAAEDGMLDMDALAVSDILLTLPSKQLCRDDCKGLCPMCGMNLNNGVCQCKKKEIDPRLQALGDLLQ